MESRATYVVVAEIVNRATPTPFCQHVAGLLDSIFGHLQLTRQLFLSDGSCDGRRKEEREDEGDLGELHDVLCFVGVRSELDGLICVCVCCFGSEDADDDEKKARESKPFL